MLFWEGRSGLATWCMCEWCGNLHLRKNFEKECFCSKEIGLHAHKFSIILASITNMYDDIMYEKEKPLTVPVDKLFIRAPKTMRKMATDLWCDLVITPHQLCVTVESSKSPFKIPLLSLKPWNSRLPKDSPYVTSCLFIYLYIHTSSINRGRYNMATDSWCLFVNHLSLTACVSYPTILSRQRAKSVQLTLKGHMLSWYHTRNLFYSSF